MRRLISIAALALSLTVPVWAQRGGVHGAVGGARGGGFSGRGGFAARGGSVSMGGGHTFGGMHSVARPGPGFSRGVTHSFNRGFTRAPLRDRGFRDREFRDRGFRRHRHHDFDDFGFNNCFGFACRNSAWGWGSPWWGWGWYDPWLWSSWEDEDRRFDDDYYRQYEMADRWNQQSLAEQRLLRQEEDDGDQDAYAPRSSGRRSAPVSETQPEAPVSPTVLVFRDQHKEEVSNYAIVGQTLWSFSAQRTKKIPLADLDVPATQKANDDRGLAFHVPGANEGQ